MDALTRDTFFNGKITIRQSRAGYRYSIDAVILASHVRPKPGDRVLDLGTGCGIIPVMLAFQFPEAGYFGVEIQSELAGIARQNVSDNHMQDLIQIVHQDLKGLAQDRLSGPMDIVLSNPPYRRADAGRINPNSQRALARHEIVVSLPDVAAAAGRLLRTAGKFVIIYVSERLADLVIQLRSVNIEPKRVRFIHSHRGSDAKLVLLEGAKAGKPGLKVGPPLVIYGSGGDYTAEVQAMFEHDA